MIARAPIPTIEELRAEVARREAELAKKRVARTQRVWAASAQVAAEHACRRVAMEYGLAEAVARVATSTARCELHIQNRLAVLAQ